MYCVSIVYQLYLRYTKSHFGLYVNPLFVCWPAVPDTLINALFVGLCCVMGRRWKLNCLSSINKVVWIWIRHLVAERWRAQIMVASPDINTPMRFRVPRCQLTLPWFELCHATVVWHKQSSQMPIYQRVWQKQQWCNFLNFFLGNKVEAGK